MKFNVTHELASYELAMALALEGELQDFKTAAELDAWLGSTTKTAIKEIAKERVKIQGESDNWSSLEFNTAAGLSDEDQLRKARERVNALWPEGA
jgi:hypothetical protein